MMAPKKYICHLLSFKPLSIDSNYNSLFRKVDLHPTLLLTLDYVKSAGFKRSPR